MKEILPLERAVEYIEHHLDENIGLKDVARETGYSYYHMTRLFSSVLGESVGRYINRRRLYNASEQLIHSGRRITDIALDCGFESPEAFSRAFKSAFGSSPANYRKAGLDLLVKAKKGLAPEDVYHIANNISRSPEFVTLGETRVAGFRGNVALSHNRIPALWERFLRDCIDMDAFLGIGYSICETQKIAYTKNSDVLFSVVVGGSVRSFDGLPPALVRKTLCAGRYAVFTHRGAFSNLYKTYRYIYGTWLPASSEELDDREDFEVYEREVLSFDDPGNEVKIYIPIKGN